jgi:flagellar basal body-associated protein FliL
MADETPAPAVTPAAAAPAAKPPGKDAPKDAPKDAKAVPGKDAKGAPVKKDPGAKKKGGPLPLILGIVGGLVLLTGASLAIIYMAVLPKLKVAEAQAKTKKVEKAAEATIGPVFEIKDMVINSADTDQIHYVKLGLAFEVATPKAVEELGTRDAMLRDLLITEFGRCSVAELNSADGRERIRKVILQRLGEKVKEIPVRNIYFTEYVGQ